MLKIQQLNIHIWQVSEFLDTKRKTAMGEEDRLIPMVSVRIGELNKRCKKKGLDSLKQSEVRNAVAKLGIGKCFWCYSLITISQVHIIQKKGKQCFFYEGKKTGQAKFYSPSKKRVTPKGCLMIKRSLFQTKVLAALDRG